MPFNFKAGFFAVLAILIFIIASSFNSWSGSARKFLGEAGGLFKETFLPQDNFKEVAVIPLRGNGGTETRKAIKEAAPNKQLTSPIAVSKNCDFNLADSPVAEKIIFNEIAWMGTEAGYDKEWIELKNISDSPADISGFQVLDKDGQIKITFRDKTIIPAGGFYLLERGEDAVPNVKADLIYAGNLRNADETLKFFDGDCNLIDVVSAKPNWPAGDNKNKFTMERNADGNGWHTSQIKEGTPKKENSAGPAGPVNSAGVAATSETAASSGNSTFTTSPPPQPEAPGAGKININTAGAEELQRITGVGPVIAGRIIDYRNANGPFRRIEDIKNVKGIGEATFSKMKDEISVQ